METLSAYWGLVNLVTTKIVRGDEAAFAMIKKELTKVKEEHFGPGGNWEIVEGSWPAGSPGSERMVSGRIFKCTMDSLGAYCERSFKEHADQPSLVFGPERYTFEQLGDMVHAVGAELRNKFGITPGDRVAIAMKNSTEYCVTVLAASVIGAVAVPLNSWWQGEELEYGELSRP